LKQGKEGTDYEQEETATPPAFNAKDDLLAKRFLIEPMPERPSQG